ncbi:MAG TPA: energy transducer TonB [Ignavibacteriaceae bacterium]|nr:energy transducer TonB [Ignavibacteriaceae bacterium]
MKNIFCLFLFTFLFSIGSGFAQEEKLDKYPEPIGGIEAMIKNVVYPISAKEAGVEGKVFVKAIIDEQGNVTETSILKSVNEDCDKAAMDAIKKTKFTPGIKDNKPVKAEVVIPVMFKLS